jgi:hypothetical protein
MQHTEEVETLLKSQACPVPDRTQAGGHEIWYRTPRYRRSMKFLSLTVLALLLLALVNGYHRGPMALIAVGTIYCHSQMPLQDMPPKISRNLIHGS